jgi:chromosome segregation ATPase
MSETSSRRLALLLLATVIVAGSSCKPDQSSIKEENERLREQMAKQEAMVSSLQEGQKFYQQQSTLLTHELREAKKETERLNKETERLNAERKALAAKLEAQLAENLKVTTENRRMSAKATEADRSLRMENAVGGQSEEFSQPLTAVCQAAETALGRNGYSLKVSVRIDQKALYVTDRKTSPAASLELPGFRNQYLVSLQTLPSKRTKLSVKAEFEKMVQGGRVLPAATEEIGEIERRLIAEIHKVLAAPGKV